ncbi:MAG: hypothetical protein Ta2B_08460 [Termitinemataceae bacterium]|nr:MAG: hypothetical protein Ta2B_08460 [Termitinemataceae bacterium]
MKRAKKRAYRIGYAKLLDIAVKVSAIILTGVEIARFILNR